MHYATKEDEYVGENTVWFFSSREDADTALFAVDFAVRRLGFKVHNAASQDRSRDGTPLGVWQIRFDLTKEDENDA